MTIRKTSPEIKAIVERLWFEREEMILQQRAKYPTAAILAAVAKAHGLDVETLRSKARPRHVSLARHHAVWEMRCRRFDLGFSQIAAELNRDDHTTALHSYQTFCKAVAQNHYRAERALVADILEGKE